MVASLAWCFGQDLIAAQPERGDCVDLLNLTGYIFKVQRSLLWRTLCPVGFKYIMAHVGCVWIG